MDKRLFQAVDILLITPVADDLPASLSHEPASLRIGQGVAQRFGQRVRIAGRENKSVFTVPHQICCRTDLVADDNRSAGIHNFIDHQSPRFQLRWQDKDVA
jgi:hypothetical protein